MTKILIAPGSFYPELSGGALVQWKLAKKAVEAGYKIIVVSATNSDNPAVEEIEGAEIRRPYWGNVFTSGQNSIVDLLRKALFAVFLCMYLPYLAHQRNVDVVYSAAHVCHPGSKIAGILVRLPVVNFVGYTPSVGSVRRPLGYFLRSLERVNFRMFLGEKIFCRTPAARKVLQQHASGRAEIIHGVVNEEAIKSLESDVNPELNLPGETRLVWVGRQVKIKQPKKAVEVLYQLGPSYGLTFVGGGPQIEQTQALVRNQKLRDRVRFKGQCSHKNTLRIVRSADALILTSRTEAYPTVVFEALSLGLDVFATPVGVLPEINHPRLNLAGAGELGRLINNSTLSGSTGINQETLENYSMERYAETMLDGWEEIKKY
jgi:glycosyltransferase involved in cell wall biosynthesis